MRVLLLLTALVFAGSGIARSQVPPPTPSKSSHKPEANPAQHNETPTKDQRGTESSPVFIKVIPPSIVEPQPATKTQSQNDYSSPEWALVYVTAVLVAFTAGLMVYTARLWRETKNLARGAKQTATQQATDMQASLTIAKKTADAAIVSSMPILSPLIVGGKLHPFGAVAELYPRNGPIEFNSDVHFVFENFGKTPGIIREVRGDLFLCEMDQFPIVDFAQLPIIDYQPIIAGDSRGQQAMMGVAEFVKPMTLSQAEFTELLNSADYKYRRFAFIGRVVYDDFFETRHTRRFCVKMRLMDQGLFQLVRGGKAYNHVERQAIPKDE